MCASDVKTLQEYIGGQVHQIFLSICSFQQKVQYSFVYLRRKRFLDLQWKLMKVELQMTWNSCSVSLLKRLTLICIAI